jgi:HlyD family secretion protein
LLPSTPKRRPNGKASCAPRASCRPASEEAARTEAEVRRAACNTAKADVAQAEAKLKATRVEQGRVALYAPFDGTVAKIVGELGEYSTPSPPACRHRRPST